MLKLYNTLTKQKQDFVPLNKEKIGMYVCGPTVYDSPHLGNALSVVVYDCLYRLLCHIFGKDKVVYVRNITDVDDKINKAAKDRSITIEHLTNEITEKYHADIAQINCLKPNFEPKATKHINEMIAIIQMLLDNENAYIKNNHVFFSVNSDPSYGVISGRNVDELLHGARVAVSADKESPEDFVLWKPADSEDDPSSVFESPWGKGRPGWHIECVAMSTTYLGTDFDIHGGGVDLLFPHHTNEIAQSCCAFKRSKYARFWVHNGFLTVNGEKMSKSLGNFITLSDLLAKNIPGEVIRYVLMSSHYRKPTDWNPKDIADAKASLDNFYDLIQEHNILEHESAAVPDYFLECLMDDLNTPMAYAHMHELAKLARGQQDKSEQRKLILKLKSCGNLLGMLQTAPEIWFHGTTSVDEKQQIENLIKQRLDAKEKRDYHVADKIRSQLKEIGIIIEDKSDGSTIWKKIGVTDE